MPTAIEIPITFRGEELIISAQVLTVGYTQKIEVDINGEKMLFEPDEERNYRPVLSNIQLDNKNSFNLDLLKAITEVFKGLK